MNDTEDKKKTVIGSTYKYEQGLHSGTVKSILRKYYNVENIILDRRLRMEDGTWWNIYFVPLNEDEFVLKHIKNIVEVVNGGVMFGVRNYHLKDKTMEEVEEILGSVDKRQEKAAEYYKEHKEKIRQNSKKYWEAHKFDPVYREKQRNYAREYYRTKKGIPDQGMEETRRNINRRIYANAIVYEDEEEIAQLLERDEAVGLTPEEQKRLEDLLNGGDRSTVPELPNDENNRDGEVRECGRPGCEGTESDGAGISECGAE